MRISIAISLLAILFNPAVNKASEIEDPGSGSIAIGLSAVPRNEVEAADALAIVGEWAIIRANSGRATGQAAGPMAKQNSIRKVYVVKNSYGRYGISDGTFIITARSREDLHNIGLDYNLNLIKEFSGGAIGQFTSNGTTEVTPFDLARIRDDFRVLTAELNSVYEIAFPQ